MSRGKKSRSRKRESYFKIYEQIYADPLISIYDIARNTGISRNTVSSYLEEMRKNGIISGPKISLNAHHGYKEHVYLLNYKDPYQVFSGMHTFPCVIHHGMAFGDWNTTILTERPLDFSQLLGYEGEVYSGVKWSSCTPRVTSTTWKEGTLAASVSERETNQLPPLKNIPLDWEEDQWKLYHAFRHDLRVPVTPLLKEIRVRYEVYSAWMETLTDHVSIHTGFYP